MFCEQSLGDIVNGADLPAAATSHRTGALTIRGPVRTDYGLVRTICEHGWGQRSGLRLRIGTRMCEGRRGGGSYTVDAVYPPTIVGGYEKFSSFLPDDEAASIVEAFDWAETQELPEFEPDAPQRSSTW